MEQMYFPAEKDNGTMTDDSNSNSDDNKDYNGEEKTGGKNLWELLLARSPSEWVFIRDLQVIGDLYTCGYNYFGQLGDSLESTAIPRQIKELKNVVNVACGEAHSIAVLADGKVYTWGCNRYGRKFLGSMFIGPGQLGVGDNLHRYSPMLLEAFQEVRVKEVAAGSQHSLVLTKTGEVWSWGCGSFGRLGHGDHKHQLFPRAVSAMRGKTVIQISAGGWFSACLSDQGAVYTWGCNRYGQLGHGKIPVQLFPRHVTGLYGKNVIKLICGKHHTVVCTDKIEILAFGAGMCGQLGNRNKKHSFVPVPVDIPADTLIDVASGNLHSVALTKNGGLYIWGYISDDQLGLSEAGEEYQADPIVLHSTNKNKFVKIFAGGWHNAAITEAGEIYTWGFAYKGRLAFGLLDEDSKHPLTPVLVEAFSDKVTHFVACGGSHTLFIASPKASKK